jgi:ribosomal protein S27AE
VVGVTLEAYRYDQKGTVATKLTECPACGHAFGEHEARWKHFLDEHGPEDLGLSAPGETPESHLEPLFVPVEDLPMPVAADEPVPQEAAEEWAAAAEGGESR